jgi:transcriptional regulator with XRE-family HTH domain
VTGRRKDLEVTVTIRNNQIKDRRTALGLTQRRLAEFAGITINAVCGFEALSRPPIIVKRIKPERQVASVGQVETEVVAWTHEAQLLARFFEVDPVELFPESLNKVKNTRVVKTLDADDMLTALGISSEEPAPPPLLDGVEQDELRDAVQGALRRLSPINRLVVEQRFGIRGGDSKTFAQIGTMLGKRRYGKSNERVRQRESRALRDLRKELKDWA